MKKRDPVFDIMKGFAIISVIIIHTGPPWHLYHLLSFFHVPLFFVISGYFAKESAFIDFVKNQFLKIFVPLVFTSSVMLFIVGVLDVLYGTHSIYVAAQSLLLGTASWPVPEYEIYVLSAGPLWFIWALILVRFYWFLLQNLKVEYLRRALILILAVTSYLSKPYLTLPFSIQASFGALGFFYAGFWIKKRGLLENETGRKFFFVCLIAFVYCIGFSNVDVNLCVYDAFYVIDVLAVVAVFFALYAVVGKYRTETRFWSLVNFIGRYSLVAFCVHSIDQNILVYWFPYKIWSSFTGNFQAVCAILLRVIFVIFITYLVSKSKFLREKIFFIK